MNPIASQCGAVSEVSSPLVGSPGYRSRFGHYSYYCNGAYHTGAIDLTVGRASFTYSILSYVTWQYPDYMGNVTESPVTTGGSIPMSETYDGPYNVAYNTQAISVTIEHGNDGAVLGTQTIPAYGLWIYQAGQRPDYPAGVYVFTIDVPSPCVQRVQVVVDQGQTGITH